MRQRVCAGSDIFPVQVPVCKRSSRYFTTYLAHDIDARAMMQDATRSAPRKEAILKRAMLMRVLLRRQADRRCSSQG